VLFQFTRNELTAVKIWVEAHGRKETLVIFVVYEYPIGLCRTTFNDKIHTGFRVIVSFVSF
ncbi:MAG: hypothetical protein RLZZ301_1845, partial [Bacteroidota bacterium]